MNTTAVPERDERTVAVENAGYRWAFIFLYFAILFDAAYRGMFLHEAPVDLMALVIVTGVGCVIYQIRHKVWSHSQTRIAVIAGLLGAIFGGIVLPLVLGMLR
jgi:hypothetical protein